MDEETQNVPPQDVNQVETDTTASSSDAQQTDQTTEEVTPEQPTDKQVPEVNRYAEEARKSKKEVDQLRAEMDELKKGMTPQQEAQDPQIEAVKQELKKLGFVTREEQQAELKQREEDLHVKNELSRLEGEYSGKDGRPKFDRQEVIDFALKRQVGDLESAYKLLHEDTLIDWRIKQAIAQSRGIKTEASDGSGSQEVGTTDSDLKDAIAKGDKNALHTFLKRLSPVDN